MPRLVEYPSDRLPAHSPLAASLASVNAPDGRLYFQLITDNEDTPKQVTDIIKGVTNLVPKVQAVQTDLEAKYKKIWDTDKDAYMRRYRHQVATRAFDRDIQLYLDHINEIRAEESVIQLDCLQIDQQPLKTVRRRC